MPSESCCRNAFLDGANVEHRREGPVYSALNRYSALQSFVSFRIGDDDGDEDDGVSPDVSADFPENHHNHVVVPGHLSHYHS